MGVVVAGRVPPGDRILADALPLRVQQLRAYQSGDWASAHAYRAAAQILEEEGLGLRPTRTVPHASWRDVREEGVNHVVVVSASRALYR